MILGRSGNPEAGRQIEEPKVTVRQIAFTIRYTTERTGPIATRRWRYSSSG
jgi:hypothetical protein